MEFYIGFLIYMCKGKQQIMTADDSSSSATTSLLQAAESSSLNAHGSSEGQVESSAQTATTTTAAATSSLAHLATATAAAPTTADHTKPIPTALQLGKRLIANLMPSSAYQPIKMPFGDDEHYLIIGAESVYYVNERSLTSIVAFALGYVFPQTDCLTLVDFTIPFIQILVKKICSPTFKQSLFNKSLY